MQFLFIVISLFSLVFLYKTVICANTEVVLQLYNREHPYNASILLFPDIKDIKPSLPLKLLIHGWKENMENGSDYMEIKDEYLKKNDVNVILMDWLAADDDYAAAVNSVKEIGINLGNFLVHISKSRQIPVSKMHVIGHSLGGQIAGVAGREIRRLTDKKLGRITGLDPARPLFEWTIFGDLFENLSRKDADMVDIIHTDAGVFGYQDPMGTVDFYPNGGKRNQPGCVTNWWYWLMYIRNIEGVFSTLGCSHAKSKDYFLASINRVDIKGIRCRSWDEFRNGTCRHGTKTTFGENISEHARGKFYLELEMFDNPFRNQV